MKRLISIIMLCSGVASGNEWSDNWPVPELPEHSLYTNVYASELDAAITRRSRWAGDSAWYSGYAYGGYLRHSNCEAWSRQITNLLPSYIPKTYSTGADYSFDDWFASTEGSLSNDFPRRMTFADTLAHAGLGLVVSQQVASLAPGFTDWTVTNGIGLWTKRNGRLNPLIVREWRYNPALDSGWWSQGYRGWFDPENEFTSGASLMPTIIPEQYPVFRYTLGSTGGVYHGNVTFTPPGKGGEAVYAVYPNSTEPPGENFAYGPQLLTTTNTRSLHPWVRFADLCGMSHSGADPSTNDRVTLYYDQAVTTYSGNVVWDWTLLPEQLNEHRAFVTNMFLVPWSNLRWTNSLACTNGWSYAWTNADLTATEPQTEFYPIYSEFTNGVYTNTTEPTPSTIGIEWWTPYCPWIDDIDYPASVTAGELFPTNSQAPYFDYRLIAAASYDQQFNAEARYCPGLAPEAEYPSTGWIWQATLTAFGGLSLTGTSVSSELVIDGLYTGSQHRAHVYVRWPFSGYRRWSIIPSNSWSYSGSLTTAVINVWSNMGNGRFETGDCHGPNTVNGVQGSSFRKDDTVVQAWTITTGTTHCVTNGWTTDMQYSNLSNAYYTCDDGQHSYNVELWSNTITALWTIDESDLWTVHIELRGLEIIECDYPESEGLEYTYWAGDMVSGVIDQNVVHYDDVEAMASPLTQVYVPSEDNCDHEELHYEITTVEDTTCLEQTTGFAITHAGTYTPEEIINGPREKTLIFWIEEPFGLVSGRTYELTQSQGPTSVVQNVRMDADVKVLIEWKP